YTAIKAAGSLNAFCDRVGVTPGNVSRMRSGQTPITGKVAEYLGVKPVLRYLEIGPKTDPKQEQYEKKRAKWAEQNGRDITRMRSARG
ncbi:hypothetical protein, partial [Microcystis sp. M40BS1]